MHTNYRSWNPVANYPQNHSNPSVIMSPPPPGSRLHKYPLLPRQNSFIAYPPSGHTLPSNMFVHKDILLQPQALMTQLAYHQSAPKSRLYSSSEQVGSSVQNRISEPTIVTSPTPPPQAMILSVQVQSNQDRQKGHFYPDSSAGDIEDPFAMEDFFQTDTLKPKKSMLRSDITFNQKSHQSKSITESVKQNRTQNTWHNYNPDFQVAPKKTDTPIDICMSKLTFKGAFENQRDTPKIYVFNYGSRS